LKLQIPNKIWILGQSPFTFTQSFDIRSLYVHRLVYTYLQPCLVSPHCWIIYSQLILHLAQKSATYFESNYML